MLRIVLPLAGRLALSIALVFGLGYAAHATADGPDAWRVTGVASDDVLNARIGPGSRYFEIDALPHDARGVQIQVCIPTVTREQYFALSETRQTELTGYSNWCLVDWEGEQRGWVNRRYLTEDN